MPSLSDFAAAVGLPLLVAAVLLPVFRRLPFGGGAGAALALGGGTLAGLVAQKGGFAWPPASSSQWIAPAVALGTAVGVAGLSRWTFLPLRVLVRFVAVAVALWFLLTAWRGRREFTEVVSTLGLLSAGAGVAWSLLELQVEGEAWRAAALALAATALSVALGLTGSVLLAMLAASLAAAFGAAFVVSWRGLAPTEMPGSVPVWVLGTTTLLVAGASFSELPMTAVPWLAFAPVPVVIARAFPPLRSRWASGAALVLELGALGWALALSVQSAPSFDGY